ncbi:MAG: hypothetical protein KDH88_09695 [Chromatiales bacterium]|nr:hypothetical protein [Chromatiales bacterium]
MTNPNPRLGFIEALGGPLPAAFALALGSVSPIAFALGRPAVGVFLALSVILPLVAVGVNGGIGRRRDTVGEALDKLPVVPRIVVLLVAVMSLLWGTVTFWLYGWANPVGYVLMGFLVTVGALISGLKVEQPEERGMNLFYDLNHALGEMIPGTWQWYDSGRDRDDD